jgi:tRNA(fMet)-specific endonuclease VapC
MESRYLLDTNIASYIIKGNNPAVDRRVVKVPALVEDFFLRVAVLAWDSDAARHYGQLRATLERQGQPMGNLDMMIGAHALALGLVLVTSDRAFARIKKLKLEDWSKLPRQ